MTFREKLNNDLDGISPSDELLSRVSQMMAEEVKKPKQPIYLNVAKWGGMAAAICLIAVGAVTFLNKGSDAHEIATADASGYSLDAASADSENTAAEEKTGEPYSLSFELPEYRNKNVYKNLYINPAVKGAPSSYEEIMNGRYDEIDSFYLLRIAGIVDKTEAAQLKGYDPDLDSEAFFYNAVIEYDYINKTAGNETVIIRIPCEEGCPPYASGDSLAVVLQKSDESKAYRKRFSYVFNYDIYELDGVSYGAVRSQSLSEAENGLTDFFGGNIVEYETTMPTNPAVYYGLYEIDGIAENLRRLLINEENAEASTFGYLNFDLDPSTIQLNENPDLSKKSIPEDYDNIDYLEPAEISDLVSADTDIVIVKILESNEYAGNSFAGEADIFSAQAEAVVESEMFLEGDIIPVFVPHSSLEADLEIGKYYLLVTEEFESGIFKIYSGRESVFEIDGHTVTVQSHLKVPSMLDGLTVEEAASILKYEQKLK